MFVKSFIMTGLATLASAHMIMNNPVPYGKSSLNNSPLDPSGSDFPCKQRSGVYDADGASNSYAQGSTQQLSFTGSAVHGGGSCQVSITTDKEPTKDSVWKVIKSIEGGCPAKGVEGNLGDNPDAEAPDKYGFTIPEELAAGEYTLAWTWFNKVGNREMYMNCAPLTVTGSGGSTDVLNDLPDMFVANVGNECETVDGDLKFPNPGSEVEKDGTSDLLDPTGSGCQKAGSSGGSDGGDSNTSAAPTSEAASQPTTSVPAPVSPSPASPTDMPGGVFITVSQPAATEPAATEPAATEPVATESPATTAAPVASEPVQSAAPVATTAPAAGSGDSGSGSGDASGGFAAGTACTSEGEWNCVGGSSFQRCASGAWTAVQQLSSGVSCNAGQSADLNMVSKRGRNMMRRASRIRA